MKITGAMLLDKRIVQRHIDSGLVSREEYEKHLRDSRCVDQAEDLNAELLDVGVKTSRQRTPARTSNHGGPMSKETDSKLFRASPDVKRRLKTSQRATKRHLLTSTQCHSQRIYSHST